MIARLKEKYPHWKRLLLIPVLASGILVFVIMVKTRQQPIKNPVQERATAVRAIEAKLTPVVPRALGYGYIQPGQVWDAVAEVSGKVVELTPEFKRGTVLRKGAVLMRIDPSDSGFVREQSEAEVLRIKAEISKLNQSEKDTRRQLEVQKGQLALVAKDLERNQKLVEQGVISQSEVDSQEQSYLSQRNAVQSYESTLNSIPSQRAALNAQLASARSKTAGARLDEERTVIRTPFDCRISSTNVELGQAVSVNQVLASLDSLNEHEALVQVPLYAFRNLLPRGEAVVSSGAEVVTSELKRFVGIDAVIRVRALDQTLEWIGHLARVSDSVDSSTRTIGLFVNVDNVIIDGRDGTRPPLIKNMYAEVELLGERKKPYVVVPRSSIEASYIKVVGANNRLERRKVEVAFTQSSLAALQSGVEPGEMVVVSELVPAIEGMLLQSQVDEVLQQRIEDEALARVAIK